MPLNKIDEADPRTLAKEIALNSYHIEPPHVIFGINTLEEKMI